MDDIVTIILGVILLVSLGIYRNNEQAKIKFQRIRKGEKRHWSADIRDFNEGESEKDIPYIGAYQMVFTFLMYGLVLFLLSYADEVSLYLGSEESNILWERHAETEYCFLVLSTITVWFYIFSTKRHYKRQGYDAKYITPSAVWNEKTKKFIMNHTDWDETIWKDVFLKYDDKRILELQHIQSSVRKMLEWKNELNRNDFLEEETRAELKNSIQEGIALIKEQIASFDKWSYFHIPTSENEGKNVVKETSEIAKVEPQTLEEAHPFISPDISDLERIVRKKDIPESLRMEAFTLLKELKEEEEEKQRLKERELSIEDAQITVDTIKKMRAKIG